jgi:hypothetical protein
MKNLLVFSIIFTMVSLLACQEAREVQNSVHPASEFYKTIGMQIPAETGNRWITTFNQRNNKQGREGALFSIEASQLTDLLQSAGALAGVAFHYGIDEAGQTHIMVIPVDETLRLWTTTPGRVIIDANTKTAVDQSVAHTWAQNYQQAHGQSIWFHFFGKNIFEEIAAIPNLAYLDIVPALNDADLSPQLLLVVNNNNTSSGNGRVLSDEAVVYDASYPCPRCEVQ